MEKNKKIALIVALVVLLGILFYFLFRVEAIANLFNRYTNFASVAKCPADYGGYSSGKANATEEAARDFLSQNGISVNSPAPKTELGGLPWCSLKNLVSLQEDISGFSKDNTDPNLPSFEGIRITGGTEPGHATHCARKGIMDISPNGVISAYMYQMDRNPTINRKGNKTYTDPDTKIQYTEELNNPGTGKNWAPHWHIVDNCK